MKRVSDDSTFNELVKEAGDKKVIIKFTASWCPPCKRIKEPVNVLSAAHPEHICLEIDFDESKTKSVCNKYGINAVPTFVMLEGGEEARRYEGAKMAAIKAMFEGREYRGESLCKIF